LIEHLPPEALDPFVVDVPAGIAQRPRRHPISPPRMLHREPVHRTDELDFLVRMIDAYR